jgi:hypothetical protein
LNKKFIGIYENTKRYNGVHSINLCFSAEFVDGKLRRSEEGKDVRFFKKLPKKIGFNHRKILKDAGIK